MGDPVTSYIVENTPPSDDAILIAKTRLGGVFDMIYSSRERRPDRPPWLFGTQYGTALDVHVVVLIKLLKQNGPICLFRPKL